VVRRPSNNSDRGAARARDEGHVSLRDRAVRLLARREYARFELEQRLVAKGGERAEVRVVLDALAAEGYLSDARYARAVVAQKAGSYSRRSIAEALKAKGVAREDVAAAVAETELDDESALRALWTRRFGRAPADERAKARQVRFLQARGFALSAILKLLRAVEARV
jgi:regulatory protein